MKALRVVVADDDPDTVLSLRLLLEHEGHIVRGVESGAEALGAVRDFGADVVLLDIDMPGMTGFAVARSMGFDHYVAKPYSPNEVLAPAGRQTSFEMTGKYSVV